MKTLLAVDGGNSKTDLALVAEDGALLGFARGPQSSPHHIGEDGCLAVLEELLARARAQARIDGTSLATLCMAGVDFPAEEERLAQLVAARGWADRTRVLNDTFAILRAGTEQGWGIAIVCGAGINCVGVAPDGRQVRFPALGAITGDWGGGYDVGLAAVSKAARSFDGRGPKTTLESTVPAHFGLTTPYELAEAIHSKQIPERRVVELPPLVFAEATRDAVAAEIVDRLAAEIVALARAALVRLELAGEAVEVLLGGGLVQGGDGRVVSTVERGLGSVGPQIAVRVNAPPPVVGAALLGLDELGASPAAQARLRAELSAAAGNDAGGSSDG
ncbi:MAG TPA: BadF/BadG/BcrA/BcrD ATPase family protein [Gaiellaceae bacterium]|nr:BadF/BadG/BcrA/BcrD ATPase family protein [Gaiellaceae bacterium]